MSDNVVALRGDLQPSGERAPPVIDERLVAEVERLLDRVRAGEIVGMAGAYLHEDRQASYSFAGRVGCFGVIGALECAKTRLLRNVVDR